MIVGIFGDVGSGKTISAIKFIHSLHSQGHKIFSNIKLTDIPYIPLSLDDLLDIVEHGKKVETNSVYFVDEITLYMDSRTSGSKIQRLLSYMLLQNRKLSIYFLYTSQYPDLIDRRLWITTPIRISCSAIHTGDKTFVRRVWYIKRLLETRVTIDYFCADPYFKYYDTREVVRLPKTSRYDKKVIKKRDSTLEEFSEGV